MNPKDRVGIHLSDAVSRIAGEMQEITVQVRGSRGRQGSGTVWPVKPVSQLQYTRSLDDRVAISSRNSRLAFEQERMPELRDRFSGLIITCAHVADAQAHDVEFSDGRSVPGWLVARDPDVDLAALAVSMRPSVVARTRSACELRAGEMVLASGNPNGDPGAITTGIVHRAPGTAPCLFADIRLAPGNSGGPLADATGAIVGINSMIINGLGCAVTSETVERFLRRFHLAEAA
jgi:hypothetical protein